MAKSATLNVTQDANNKGITFVNADGTTAKDLFVADATDGSKLYSIAATTSDTSANNVQLFYNDGTTSFLIATVRVAIASGTDGEAASVNLLNAAACPFVRKDNGENPFIEVKAGHKITVAPLVAVTADKTLTLVALGEDY